MQAARLLLASPIVHRRVGTVVLVAAVALGGVLQRFTLAGPADRPAAADTAGRSPSGWKFETVILHDGQVLHGLVKSSGQEELEFVEVVRPQGRPMYLVVRPVATSLISTVTRLPADQQRELAGRLERFRNRSRIEAGRMQDVVLAQVEQDGVTSLQHTGDWFRFRSTADEEMTRRSVVRSEQIFRAYRQLLPPRHRKTRQLDILLFGSLDEYRQYLQRRGTELGNPAFYSQRDNLIVAGSQLERFAARLAAVRRQAAETLRQCAEIDASLSDRLAQMARELTDSGVSRDQVRTEVAAQRRAWQTKHASVLKGINEAERRNSARFSELTDQMFRRMSHEALHAYLENYVYPAASHDVPRWLNEGLALVFEGAQMDEDTMRVDAPDGERLGRLQAELRRAEPLRLVDFVVSEQQRFLTTDTHTSLASQRHYDYSWGLVYYLAFHQQLLGSQRLEQYVAPESARLPAVARFERFVQMPLPEFEKLWHREMLSLYTHGRD